MAGRAVDAAGTWLGRRPSPGSRSRIALGISLLAFLAILIGNENYTAATKALLKDVIRVAKAPSTFFAPPPDMPWSGSKEDSGRDRPSGGSGDGRRCARHRPSRATGLHHQQNRRERAESAPGFRRNPRTGIANIGEPASIEKVIACSASGAVVVPEIRWRTFDFVTPETADRIEAMAKPVTPGVEGFRIYQWAHPQTGGPDCKMVRELLVNRQ